jgi:hypothetical protein
MGSMAAGTTLEADRRDQAVGRLSGPLRDIARGGVAGLLTGFLVAGMGGRAVMRAAALLVPEAGGRLTDNGNRIGEITLSGTIGLVLAGGLFFGLLGATIWVVVSPWIPGGGRTRALLAMPIAVSLTGISLVQARNPDFVVLRHDATTVGLLLALVALAGLTIAGFDAWLDRRLPGPGVSGRSDGVYLALSVAGGALILPIVLAGYLGEERPLGLVLVGVGVATLIHWTLRYRGRSAPPTWLVVAGRGSLLGAVVVGVLALAPDVAAALGVR